MGHDTHFLQRLGRASLPQAELAMTLYHDQALVQAVLAQTSWPDQIDQVAVSLTPEDTGPFAVLARTGRFVTCLAQGMRPTAATAILPYSGLERATKRIEKLRGHLRLSQELKEEKLRVRELLRRLCHKADAVSREEIEELLPFQPILAFHFLCESIEQDHRVRILRNELLRRTRLSVRKQDHQHLRAYWDALWASSHLLGLACADNLDWAELALPRILPIHAGILSWTATATGYLPTMWRTFWAVARLGKPILANYKQEWAEARADDWLFNGGLGLAVLGLRHAKLAGEVRKCLAAPPTQPLKSSTALRDALVTALESAFLVHDLAPNSAAAMVQVLGAAMLVEGCKVLGPIEGRPNYTKPEEVPFELASTYLVHLPGLTSERTEFMQRTALLLPWIASCRLAELYAPRALVGWYHLPWQPEQTMRILEGVRYTDVIRQPVRQPTRPGRNDPCSCGSGRKYKKCCGAGGADPGATSAAPES